MTGRQLKLDIQLFLCPLFSRQGLCHKVTELVITLPQKIDRATTYALTEVSEATLSIVRLNYVEGG